MFEEVLVASMINLAFSRARRTNVGFVFLTMAKIRVVWMWINYSYGFKCKS